MSVQRVPMPAARRSANGLAPLLFDDVAVTVSVVYDVESVVMVVLLVKTDVGAVTVVVKLIVVSRYVVTVEYSVLVVVTVESCQAGRHI